MSEVVQPGGAEGTPSPAPVQAAEGTPPAAPAVPAGYVPQTELERERERSRGFQSELDRTKAELLKLQSASQTSPNPAPAAGETDFDPYAFRNELLRDVSGVITIAQTAENLKAAFPKVAEFDPSIFSPDRLAGFRDVESLRVYVEDVNSRLTKLLQPQQQLTEQEQRDAAAAAAAGSAGPNGATPPPAGDPTAEQLAAMTPTQIDRLEQERPGVIERVLASVGAV